MITGRIYSITNKINNKKYVGKTLSSIEERFEQHIANRIYHNHRPLYMAMNKYGIENFSIALLEEIDYTKLSEREQYWIKTLDTYHNGYNATLGGDGKVLYDYEAIIDKYRAGMLIKEIAEYFECSIDTVHTVLLNSGYDTKENCRKSRSKKVRATSTKNEVYEFDSQMDAARWLIREGYTDAKEPRGISSNIGKAVKGKQNRKTYLDFKWEQI